MLGRVVAVFGLICGTAAYSGSGEFSGFVGAELSYFPGDGLYPGQLGSTQTSLVFAPEFRWDSDDGDTLFQLSAFGRVDAQDDERTHFDLREAYIRHQFENFDALVGINKVFWGVTESRHLVDIINQVDLLEYTTDEARLGQPMIELKADQDWGSLGLFIMSGFREQQFPGTEGRLRFPLPVDEDAAVFASSSGTSAVDYALRYFNTFGSIDLGLSYFHGTSREPVLTPNGGGTALVPYYGRIWQAGIDAQYTGDALLLKLEAIARGSDDFSTFGAAVLGLEYTVYQVGGSDGDLGLIAEYLADNRGAGAPSTIFQDDLFLGARWAANDSQDTSALVGAIIDMEDSSTALRVEFERRLEIGLTLEVTAQFYSNTDPANPLHGFRQDDYVSVALEKHF